MDRDLTPRAAAPLQVLIAGGGIAAAEAVIGLRALAGERVSITLLSPHDELIYHPVSVLAPFSGNGVHRVPLESLAEEFDLTIERASLAWVAPGSHRAFTSAGAEISYDVLIVAAGARRIAAFDTALTFDGFGASGEMRALLKSAEAGMARRVAFVVPPGVTWSLPLYELALMTAARLREARVEGAELTLVTPEQSPLGLFGEEASREVANLLAAAGIRCDSGVEPEVPDPGTVVAGERVVGCDRVVALPVLRGPAMRGLPSDEGGFLRVTPFGHVLGVKDVYAAGDATSFPIKQGGVACQQADVVAQVVARRAGAPVTPTGHRPVLRGKLLTGARPRWLRSDRDRRGRGEESAVADHVLWWPPGKVAGDYLAPYLNEPPPPEDTPIRARAVISTGRDRGEFRITAMGERDSVLAGS